MRDLKEGFNQVDNEPETAKKMAVLAVFGCYVPRGLTIGPANGPEDFQELVFMVFGKGLYIHWFLFLDDSTVATCRPKSFPPGPSGATDVENEPQLLGFGSFGGWPRSRREA